MNYFEMKNSKILWEGAWGGAMHYAIETAKKCGGKHPLPTTLSLSLSLSGPQFSCLRHSTPTAFSTN